VEVAGTIAALGEGVTGYAEGQMASPPIWRLLPGMYHWQQQPLCGLPRWRDADGAFAEYMRAAAALSQGNVIPPKPESIRRCRSHRLPARVLRGQIPAHPTRRSGAGDGRRADRLMHAKPPARAPVISEPLGRLALAAAWASTAL
jgi:hypothetical protein